MSVIEGDLRAQAGTLRLAQPSIQIDVLLKHSRIGDIGVASLAGPQFVVEKIKFPQRPPCLLRRDGFKTQRSVPLTQYGLSGRFGFYEFKQLPRASVDPGNSSALEGHGRDGRRDNDASMVLGMSQRVVEIVGLETEMVGSAAALCQHGADRGVLTDGCDEFNLGSVLVRPGEKVNRNLLDGIIERTGNDFISEQGREQFGCGFQRWHGHPDMQQFEIETKRQLRRQSVSPIRSSRVFYLGSLEPKQSSPSSVLLT